MPTEQGCRRMARFLLKRYRKHRSGRIAKILRDSFRYYARQARRLKKLRQAVPPLTRDDRYDYSFEKER